MTGPVIGTLPRGEIGYRNGDNSKLHTALFEAWNSRCHDCEQTKYFVDTQIDHIIPRSLADAEVRDLMQQHGLPDGFHVDRPRNLALICTGCNRKKSNRTYPRARSYTDLLDEARTKEWQVIRRVRRQATANVVAKHLTGAATASLHDAKIQKAYREHAPAIVRQLALLDERAADFDAVRDFDFHLGHGYFMPVSMRLDASGRAAQHTIETIGGCSVPDALEDGLRQITTQIDAEVADRIERYRGETGDIGPVSTDTVSASLKVRDVRRRGDRLTARFTGSLRGSFTASVVDDNAWGDGLTEKSVTTWVEVDFAIRATWKLTGALGRPHRVRARLTANDIDTTRA